MELVIKHGEEYATTSQIIAANTNNEHASTMKLVRDYIGHLEQFGGVRFEIDTFETAGGKQKREIAILNEQQATFLLTLMRNSEIVVRFKVELVKEFYRLRNQAPVIQFAIPQTFAEALRLAADATEQKERSPPSSPLPRPRSKPSPVSQKPMAALVFKPLAKPFSKSQTSSSPGFENRAGFTAALDQR